MLLEKYLLKLAKCIKNFAKVSLKVVVWLGFLAIWLLIGIMVSIAFQVKFAM